MLQRINNILERPSTIITVVVLAAAFSVAGIVLADTATTSVTVGNSAPVVNNVSFNGNSNLSLSENTFVRASATMTITDANGVGTNSGGQCSGVSSVNATFYRTVLATNGTTCTYDGNNCYTSAVCMATSTDDCTGGSDTTVNYECGFDVWYIADATDAGPFSSDIWAVAATSSDGTDTGTATNTGETIEVNSLFALDVTASIAYGTLGSGSNTGTTDQTATSTNTGNRAQDNQIGGDNMCITAYDPACTAPDIAESQQKFATTTGVDYSSKFNTLAASATPATIELDLPKPTATTSAVEDPTFWGIAIPPAQTNGSYAGENTFTAVAD